MVDKFFKLDNEASQAVKDTLTNLSISFELAPPHMHRSNIAERMIQAFKSHLKRHVTSVHEGKKLFKCITCGMEVWVHLA